MNAYVIEGVSFPVSERVSEKGIKKCVRAHMLRMCAGLGNGMAKTCMRPGVLGRELAIIVLDDWRHGPR
jgi:hypothetical protein